MLNLLQYGFAIAVIAVVYCCILVRPGELLGGWYAFWMRFNKDRKDPWWWKISVGCAKCFAGQVAFWTYLVKHDWRTYRFEHHLFLVAFSILLAYLLGKLVEKV